MVLERSGLQVVSAVLLTDSLFRQANSDNADVHPVDLDSKNQHAQANLDSFLEKLGRLCEMPVLFNDNSALADAPYPSRTHRSG